MPEVINETETISTADIAGRTNRTGNGSQPMPGNTDERAALFNSNEAQDFRSRWEQVQSSFVDEPKAAVEQADQLVASAIKRLAEVFADERAKLENEWEHHDDVSTEELRVALRRYRSFFSRILSI